jgi:hypothetical protein
VLFLLTSCEEDSLISGNSEELSPAEVAVTHTFKGSAFQVQEGRIKFDSEKQLFATVRAMVGDYDEAAEFFTNLPDYSSSREAYLDLISGKDLTLDDLEFHSSLIYRFERDGDSYVDHTIDDLGLEYLANAEGVFEAGPYMYDLSERNHPVKIPAEAYTQNADVRTFQKSEAIPIELYRLENSGFLKVDVRTCRTDFNSRRVTGQLEKSHVYASDGNLWNFNVRTRFFRKRLGIYWGVQASELGSEWDLWINLVNAQGVATPTRFQGSHAARHGDRQNTRFMLVEETTEDSNYMSGQLGLNRSKNRAVEGSAGSGECNCGL